MSEKEIVDADFERPEILEPEESEPIELEEAPDYDISVPEDAHFDEGLSPEDMAGVETVEDE